MTSTSQAIGRYRIIEELGSGGMGLVYRAFDPRLHRDVAVKLPCRERRAAPEGRRQFRAEARLLSRVRHPNVQIAHDFGCHDDVDYLVTEYIPGDSLSGELGEPLAERRVAHLGGQLAAALAAAHREGVVHRDVSPSNLRVTPADVLKLVDFGIARSFVPASRTAPTVTLDSAAIAIATGVSSVSGTLPYMAPEQLRGDPVDARSDLYSAGAVLYEMATGRPPFVVEPLPRLIDAILNQEPPAPRALTPEISPVLDAIIRRCLSKDPGARFASAGELAAALRSIGKSEGPRRVPRLGAVRRRHAVLRTAAVALILTLGVLLAPVLSVGGGRMPEPGLAVLGFESFGVDPAFGEALGAALTSELALLDGVEVLWRRRARADSEDVEALGAIADLESLRGYVDGTVHATDGGLRVTVHLIDAETERYVWVGRYEHEGGDEPVSLLAHRLAGELGPRVGAPATP